MSQDRNWCEIYVDGWLSCKKLTGEVLSCIDGTVGFTDGRSVWDVDAAWGDLSVRENDDHRFWRKRKADDGSFLYYKYLIDADQRSSEWKEDYEAAIQGVAQHLRGRGLRVVVVSNFCE